VGGDSLLHVDVYYNCMPNRRFLRHPKRWKSLGLIRQTELGLVTALRLGGMEVNFDAGVDFMFVDICT
jgi:hypothetical protein